MTLVEALTVHLAAALLKTTAKLWFKDRPFAEGAAGSLVDSLKQKIEDFETRRATERLFDGLQDEMARRLERLVDLEFSSLPENERKAAALAVADVLEQLPVPESLLAANLDAVQLEFAARPARERVFSALSTDGRALAVLLLPGSCNDVVTLAGKLPDFQPAATREILKRHSELLAELGRVLDALAAMHTDPRLDRASEAREFELQYRRALDRRLDRLDLFGVRLVGGGARDYPLTVAYVSLTATALGGDMAVRVEDALAGAERIVIRGEAGSGKTTLLQWLAVRAANRDFPGALAAWNERLPIYLALRDYTVEPLPRPERFLDHIAANLIEEMPRGWCHDVLRARALLLIDGIDELPQLRSLELGYLPLDSLDGIEQVSGLEHLKLAGLAAPLPESLARLQRLCSLTISYPRSPVRIPYEQLALEELWLQGIDRTMLSGLERASQLVKLHLSQVDDEGALVLSLPPSLEKLSVFHQAEMDLLPLVNAPGLEHLYLNDIRDFRSVDALLRLARLERLTFAGCVLEPSLVCVIETLRDRGVAVTV